MAVGTDFEQANFTLRGNGDDVSDLRAHRDEMGSQTITCWKLSPAEIAEINKTGVVWLYVLGRGHPPVSVQGRNPWQPPEEPPELEIVTILQD